MYELHDNSEGQELAATHSRPSVPRLGEIVIGAEEGDESLEISNQSPSPPVDSSVYSLKPHDTAGPRRVHSLDSSHDAPVEISSSSPLHSQGLQAVIRPRMVGGEDVSYPGRIELLNVATGERQVLAEAVWHETQRPRPSGVITPDGTPEVEIPDPAPTQRASYHPPDELRVDELPADPREATDSLEAVLRAYVNDATNRLAEPDPAMPGWVRFRSETLPIGFTDQPVPLLQLQRELLGAHPVGLNRITLNDFQSNTDAQQGVINTPHTEAVRAALARFGCEVLQVESVLVGSERVPGIELRFTRRNDIDLEEVKA